MYPQKSKKWPKKYPFGDFLGICKPFGDFFQKKKFYILLIRETKLKDSLRKLKDSLILDIKINRIQKKNFFLRRMIIYGKY